MKYLLQSLAIGFFGACVLLIAGSFSRSGIELSWLSSLALGPGDRLFPYAFRVGAIRPGEGAHHWFVFLFSLATWWCIFSVTIYFGRHLYCSAGPMSLLRRRRDAMQTWSSPIAAGESGLSPFQEKALWAIRQERANLEFRTEGQSDRYLVAPVPPSGVLIYVYRDGAALQGVSMDVRFERWDYESPTELIDALIKKLRGLP